MKKILFVQLHSGIGGATTSLFQLIKGLNPNYEIEVLITGGEGPLTDWLRDLGVKVTLYSGLLSYGHGNGARTPFWSVPPFRPITDLFKLPGSIRKYRELIRQSDCDLVYLNTSIIWPAAIAAKKEKKLVITHVREVWYHGLLGLRKRFFIRLTEGYSDLIITLSEFSKSQFFDKNKIHVVYNAVDFNKFDLVEESKSEIRKSLGIKDDSPFIIMLGGAMTHKGGIQFVDAASHLIKKYSNARFAILGHTQAFYAPQLKTTIKSMLRKLLIKDPGSELQEYLRINGLSDKIILPGPVNDVARWIKAADIVVFPATVDHFGRPIIEAGYMKIPAIASDLDTSRELIPDNNNGLLFRNGNPLDLTEKIEEILRDPTLANQMGEKGRTLALERYSLEKQVAKINGLVTKLLTA